MMSPYLNRPIRTPEQAYLETVVARKRAKLPTDDLDAIFEHLLKLQEQAVQS